MVLVIFFLTIVSMIFYLQLIRFLVGSKNRQLLIFEKNTVLFVKQLTVLLTTVFLLNISLISAVLDVSTFFDLMLLV